MAEEIQVLKTVAKIAYPPFADSFDEDVGIFVYTKFNLEADFINPLLTIDGVASIWQKNKYKMLVKIGCLFNPNDVIKQICDVMGKYLIGLDSEKYKNTGVWIHLPEYQYERTEIITG